jgi:prephenate dehydratase
MKIAIQGELGSFSHEAAEAMVPRAVVVPCARSLEVFDRVQRKSVDCAVIPIENSLAGSVAEHFDLLLSRDVHIVREFRLRIVHNLIALPGAKLRDIRRVFSHPVALDQCRDLFARNSKLEPVPFYDTAGSVKHVVAEGLRDAAGIASRRAAEVYKGKILKAGVEDDKKNFTRFFFALRDISLSKIESRPLRGRPWEYAFFVDLLRGDDEDTRNAMRHLGEISDLVKVLGFYPEA